MTRRPRLEPDHRLGRSGAVLLVVLLAAVLAGSALTYAHLARAGDPETGGYPQRIGFERPSDRLPDRPGPLAATLYDNDFGNGRELGVTATGRLWELPRGTSALSPSGMLLLTQRASDVAPLVVRDLATGDRWSLPRTGWQGPLAHWSPDETAVLGSFDLPPRPRRPRPATLDLESGVLTPVGGGEPAGFRSPSEPVTVHRVGGPSAPGGIVATTTDLDTGVASGLRLRLAGPWLGDPDWGLVASVAPDGRTMLLVERSDDGTRVRTFSLLDGTELGSRNLRGWDGCAPSWLDSEPVLPTTTQPGGTGSTRWAGASLLTDEGETALVAVHPRLQSSCLQLTAAALETGPRWAFFGTATATWTWYPVPVLIALSVLVLGPWLVVRGLRREWAAIKAEQRRAGT